MRLRIVLAIGLLGASAAAHDLYLVAEGQGAKRKVCARIGEHFPASMNAMPPGRVGAFQVRGGDSKVTKLEGKVEEAAKQTCATLPARADIVEMTVNPNFIRLAAKDFNGYIEGEGFKAVIAERKQSGQMDGEGRELYSRFSKLILPGAGKEAIGPLGHVLEIVPELSPDKVKVGGSMPVRVLFRGRPLAGVRIAAVYAGAKLEGHAFPVNAETDAEGRANLKIDRPGLWYVRLIHMVPSGGDPDYDWRSFFATLTFEVPAEAQTK